MTTWGISGGSSSRGRPRRRSALSGFVLVFIGYFYVLLKLFFWQQSSRMAPVNQAQSQSVRLMLSDSFENARRKSIVQSSLKVKTELERVGNNTSLLKNKVICL